MIQVPLQRKVNEAESKGPFFGWSSIRQNAIRLHKRPLNWMLQRRQRRWYGRYGRLLGRRTTLGVDGVAPLNKPCRPGWHAPSTFHWGDDRSVQRGSWSAPARGGDDASTWPSHYQGHELPRAPGDRWLPCGRGDPSPQAISKLSNSADQVCDFEWHITFFLGNCVWHSVASSMVYSRFFLWKWWHHSGICYTVFIRQYLEMIRWSFMGNVIS